MTEKFLYWFHDEAMPRAIEMFCSMVCNVVCFIAGIVTLPLWIIPFAIWYFRIYKTQKDETNEKQQMQNSIDKYTYMTNADRIRNMSDEELAKFIRATSCCSSYGADCGYPFCPNMNGELCNGIKDNTDLKVLHWLQTEVEV